MSDTNDSAGFFNGGSAKYQSFKQIGASVTGTITEEPVLRQQTDFASGALLCWPDGNPKQVLVVVLQTTEQDGPNDDGRRSIWAANPGGLRTALGKAVHAAGAKQLDVGGTLTITYVKDGDRPANTGYNPPKVYEAVYVPPAATAPRSWQGPTRLR